jgi:hypothetical protein
MGWYDTVKVSEPSIRGADYSSVIAASNSANDKLSKALEGIGNIFSEPERMKREAMKDYDKQLSGTVQSFDNFTEKQTKRQTSDAINSYNNEVSKIKASGLPIEEQMKQIQGISLGDSNSLADFGVLNNNKTSVDNELNNRLEYKLTSEQAKKFHEDSIKLQEEQNRIQEARYNDEKKTKKEELIAEAATYNDPFLHGSDIQSQKSTKLIGKEHTKENDAKIIEKIANATKGDTTLDKYGDNITFADKFAKNPTSETGIDSFYANKGTRTQTVTGPDGKESQIQVPISSKDIDIEIDSIKKNGLKYQESASGDPYKVKDKEAYNLNDIDRKVKILELEKESLNPNLTKDQYTKILNDQKTIADSMKTDNITKATNRANDYYSDASTGFVPTVDKYSTIDVPKDDKTIFEESKARIKAELGDRVSQERAENIASKGASLTVKKNAENRKAYDERISEKAKIAYDNSSEQGKEALKVAKEKLDGFKGKYDSLTSKNSVASGEEQEDALFEYVRAQKEYDDFLSSHLNNKVK